MKKDRLEELTVNDYQGLVDEWIKTLKRNLAKKTRRDKDRQRNNPKL